MAGKRTLVGFAVILASLLASGASAQLIGDHNSNGVLDAADLDLQAHEFSNGWDPSFDLNDDGIVSFQDRELWVYDLKGTWFGDANLDLKFNSSDFVQVFQRGKYETNEAAGWEEGDWNGDMFFSSADFVMVLAYSANCYEDRRF